MKFLIVLFLLAVINLSQTHSLTDGSGKPKKIIIDTDAGGDDALAILLALKYEALHNGEIEIIAITCTHGNTEEKNVELNVLKILTIAERNDIPVYGGAEKSLTREFKGTKFFGNDGFGDFEFDQEITVEIDRSKYAAVALTDLVKSNPGEVSIIALGPLTNIALAIKLDSKFIENVDELIIVGSAVAGVGNEEPNVEFNFAADPESNFIVLNSTIKPCILLPWETVSNAEVGKEWRNNVFGKLNSSMVNFLNKVEAIGIGKLSTWSEVDGVAIAIVLWPNLIKEFIVTNVTPVYDGAARGSVLVDYWDKTGKAHNAKIIQEYDLELFKRKLVQYFSDV